MRLNIEVILEKLQVEEFSRLESSIVVREQSVTLLYSYEGRHNKLIFLFAGGEPMVQEFEDIPEGKRQARVHLEDAAPLLHYYPFLEKAVAECAQRHGYLWDPSLSSKTYIRLDLSFWQERGLCPVLDGQVLVWKLVDQYLCGQLGFEYHLGEPFRCDVESMACAGPMGALRNHLIDSSKYLMAVLFPVEATWYDKGAEAGILCARRGTPVSIYSICEYIEGKEVTPKFEEGVFDALKLITPL